MQKVHGDVSEGKVKKGKISEWVNKETLVRLYTGIDESAFPDMYPCTFFSH